MPAMKVVVFEDHRVGQLNPIAMGRPAYAISCGSYRLVDWFDELQLPWCGVVRPHLRALQEQDYGVTHLLDPTDRPALIVNARTIPSLATLKMLGVLKQHSEPVTVWSDDTLVAAHIPPKLQKQLLRGESLATLLSSALRSEGIAALPRMEADVAVFDYPHDVIRWNTRILPENLEHRIRKGNYEQVVDGVFIAEGARLGQFVVSETRNGPIVLEAGASIGPYTYLSGPVYLGQGARVIEHSAIKDGVSIAHTTKIGGEVEASVIEPYTNKQHHGFLGHSYLGSWINLGAGTCNSDLKNTYGEVKMEYRGRKVATGMQFVGCIIGDYSKTAINTSIFTGKSVGVCSMVYGFVTTNVPSFVNYARSFGQVTELPAEVMIATQQRMFARRNVKQRECDVQIMREMYALTVHERQLAGEPLSL